METSLNDMSETNGLNEENLSSLKGMLHQLFHFEDKDLGMNIFSADIGVYRRWRL